MILCCGEALIDFVPLPEGSGYRPLPGGSIFNTAVAVSRLGAPVGLFTRLSTDFFGELLVEALSANEVDTRFLLRTDDPTTLAFISLPGERLSEPRYQFYTIGSADRGLGTSDLPAELPEQVCALHFGSISLVLEPGASSLEALLKRETSRRVISLDPNIRPSLIPDREAYRSRFEGWLEHIDILRLSTYDFEWLFPGADQAQLIGQWLTKGPCLCFLTRGEQGASAYTAHTPPIHLPAVRIQAADTVGAGDSFMGACLASLYRQGRLYSRKSLETMSNRDIQACLSFGVRAATITCTRQGADPPTLDELLSTGSKPHPMV
jgi:fructokinase